MVVDTEVMQKVTPKVVFSPIHGCGAISSMPVLRKLGVEVIEVLRANGARRAFSHSQISQS